MTELDRRMRRLLAEAIGEINSAHRGIEDHPGHIRFRHFGEPTEPERAYVCRGCASRHTFGRPPVHLDACPVLALRRARDALHQVVHDDMVEEDAATCAAEDALAEVLGIPDTRAGWRLRMKMERVVRGRT